MFFSKDENMLVFVKFNCMVNHEENMKIYALTFSAS